MEWSDRSKGEPLHEAGATDFHLVYTELRRTAARLMRGEARSHTLVPTALVHEAYARVASIRPELVARPHEFVTYAARAMRSILVDHARYRERRATVFLPKGEGHSALSTVVAGFEDRTISVLVADEAIEELARFDEAMARAVEMRFFAGLDFAVIASALGMPLATFARNWSVAMRWLARRFA